MLISSSKYGTKFILKVPGKQLFLRTSSETYNNMWLTDALHTRKVHTNETNGTNMRELSTFNTFTIYSHKSSEDPVHTGPVSSEIYDPCEIPDHA